MLLVAMFVYGGVGLWWFMVVMLVRGETVWGCFWLGLDGDSCS